MVSDNVTAADHRRMRDAAFAQLSEPELRAAADRLRHVARRAVRDDRKRQAYFLAADALDAEASARVKDVVVD